MDTADEKSHGQKFADRDGYQLSVSARVFSFFHSFLPPVPKAPSFSTYLGLAMEMSVSVICCPVFMFLQGFWIVTVSS